MRTIWADEDDLLKDSTLLCKLVQVWGLHLWTRDDSRINLLHIYQCTKNSESLEEMADFNFYFHFIQFIQQFILQFIHSPHWIDLFSSSPQIWPFTFYHLIKEAKIGSEVVGADEENILSRSRSSGQKWEAAGGGEKQEQSICLFRHLKYSNLVMAWMWF